MKESTKNALETAAARVAGEGHTVTEAGFKYHSERTWVALTEENGVALVTLGDRKGGGPDVVLYTKKGGQVLDATAAEYGPGRKRGKTDVTVPAGTPAKAKKKVRKVSVDE